jgi:outer membrane protein OmpA-like peptidoglycan-associated protein
MNKSFVYFPLALFTLAIAGCSTPVRNGSDLKAAIDASTAGHYGQALLQEDLAEKNRHEADRVLRHIEKDQYWNIDEKQLALNEAKQAEQHRLASEKEMCAWLDEVHGSHHHVHNEPLMAPRKVAAYFRTGSDVPYKVNDADIVTLAHFLQTHSGAKAMIVASTDTVGKPAYNKELSQRRAHTVAELLVKHGAHHDQLSLNAIGEVPGPANVANQEERVATISVSGGDQHAPAAPFVDCSKIH